MYTKDQIKKFIIVDIETTSGYKSYKEFYAEKENEVKFWDKKAEYLRKETAEFEELSNAELYEKSSALYPEFGKINCISIGQIKFDDDVNSSFLKRSFYGDDEKKLLHDFLAFASGLFNKVPDAKFVGHNIKRFDFPYILRRAILNGLPIPSRLKFHRIKPWENCLVDTMEDWRFGGQGSISLEHLSVMLGILNPKEVEIYQNPFGNVASAYWEGKIEEIKDYCEGDIEATANIVLKVSQLNLLEKREEINKI